MINIYCAHDEIVEIEKLIPNPRNPNTHPQKQIELLAKIIKSQGWRAPITVSNRSGFVVRGHGRLLAAQLLGVGEVPVDRQDYATEAEEWADLIADNRIAELSQIDDTMLASLLADLNTTDFDVNLTRFSDKQIDNLLADFNTADVKEDNFDPAAAAADIKEPVTKPGDIWHIGRHRLMCGDATMITHVEALMDGSLAAMVFTDPPYNVAYEGGTADKLTIQNDNMPADQFGQFLHDAFATMFLATQLGGAIYVCYSDSEGSNFRGAFQDTGWLLKQCLVWAKNQFVLGRQDYQWQHESILYGWKPGAPHRFFGGRKQGTIIEEAAPISVRKDEEGVLLTFMVGIQTVTIRVPSFEVLQSGDDSLSTVWRFEIASGVTDTSYVDTDVVNGTTYYYVVIAVNDYGESDNSNEASATPQATGKALLLIKLVDGLQKEYQLTETEVNAFIDWYNTRAGGTGDPCYIFSKDFNLGPFDSRKDYLAFEKIQNFEVMAFTE